MGYIWDLIQFAGIRDAQRSADRARGKADEATSSHESLEVRFERLALVSQAMWEILRETSGITEEQLIAKMREIDISDGKLDGRRGHTVKKCDACHRMMSPRHQKCIYCGAARLTKSPFEDV